MARRVFFSFHYTRDAWRASIVRNSWVTKPNSEEAGFVDAAAWETIERQGDAAVKRWIDNQLNGTSVTVVLIGAETSSRDWVRYEIRKSHERGNGIVGIYIHNIKDRYSQTDTKGNHSFGELERDSAGNSVYFFELYKAYDWVTNQGYANLGKWIEEAANGTAARRRTLFPR